MNISYIIKTERVKSRHLLAFSTTKAWAITLNTIFNTSMAILLLYIFNPFYKTKEITNYVKI